MGKYIVLDLALKYNTTSKHHKTTKAATTTHRDSSNINIDTFNINIDTDINIYISILPLPLPLPLLLPMYCTCTSTPTSTPAITKAPQNKQAIGHYRNHAQQLKVKHFWRATGQSNLAERKEDRSTDHAPNCIDSFVVPRPAVCQEDNISFCYWAWLWYFLSYFLSIRVGQPGNLKSSRRTGNWLSSGTPTTTKETTRRRPRKCS